MRITFFDNKDMKKTHISLELSENFLQIICLRNTSQINGPVNEMLAQNGNIVIFEAKSHEY